MYDITFAEEHSVPTTTFAGEIFAVEYIQGRAVAEI